MRTLPPAATFGPRLPSFAPVLARVVAPALVLVLTLAACGDRAAAGGGPPGFDTPESAVHDERDDVYYVSNIRGAPLAKDGNGYIARVEPDGAMRRHWIEGGKNGVVLHAPKGLAIAGDELWVADIDVLRRFDRASGKPLGEVVIPGATFLNDVSVGPDGAIYCTDTGLDAQFAPTGTDAIWRIVMPPPAPGTVGSQPTVEPLLRSAELGQPNGLVATKGGVYVVSWRDGTFCQVDYRGVRTELGKAPSAQLDGLVRVETVAGSDGKPAAPAWLTTSWLGKCVYRFDVQGGCTALPGTYEQPADLGWDGKRRRLLVPLFGANRLEVLPFGDGR